MSAVPSDSSPRSPFLAHITSLTAVASVTAVGLIVIGVLALVGGHYDRQVVHDQLAPQKVFFPPKGSEALLPGIKQYAGQQVLNGEQAKAYSDKFINVHLAEVAGGKTYSETSTASRADPKNAALIAQTDTLFRGETLRGLLLNAWGWSVVATVATIAGWVLIVLGMLLFVLPLLNWQVNLRRRETTQAAAPVKPAADSVSA